MRLGSLSINDPLLGASNDYAELGKLLPDHFQDIHNTRPPPTLPESSSTVSTSNRWAPSSSGRRNVSSLYDQSIGSSSMTHIRNSYESEDIATYDRARTLGNSTGSIALCGVGGTYYSPSPGTSYTIVERSHSPHFYYNNSAAESQASSSSKSRGYLESLKQNGQKQRQCSPERMFPTTLSSTSSYHHLHTNGRSSPPVSSSSHHRNSRDRSMVTRTVTIVRDIQPDGTHGFGICVKGGRETGKEGDVNY